MKFKIDKKRRTVTGSFEWQGVLGFEVDLTPESIKEAKEFLVASFTKDLPELLKTED